MTVGHLNQIELAARWNISHRTLERWRWSGEGPANSRLAAASSIGSRTLKSSKRPSFARTPPISRRRK